MSSDDPKYITIILRSSQQILELKAEVSRHQDLLSAATVGEADLRATLASLSAERRELEGNLQVSVKQFRGLVTFVLAV